MSVSYFLKIKTIGENGKESEWSQAISKVTEEGGKLKTKNEVLSDNVLQRAFFFH